jgi:hypothetical protein
MKTLIIAAALVSSFAFVATHAHAQRMVIGTDGAATPVAAPAATPSEVPAVLYIPEQVIAFDASHVTHVSANATHHVETHDEHVARLMTATPEMVSCAACTPRKPFESMSGRVSHLGDR